MESFFDFKIKVKEKRTVDLLKLASVDQNKKKLIINNLRLKENIKFKRLEKFFKFLFTRLNDGEVLVEKVEKSLKRQKINTLFALNFIAVQLSK